MSAYIRICIHDYASQKHFLFDFASLSLNLSYRERETLCLLCYVELVDGSMTSRTFRWEMFRRISVLLHFLTLNPPEGLNQLCRCLPQDSSPWMSHFNHRCRVIITDERSIVKHDDVFITNAPGSSSTRPFPAAFRLAILLIDPGTPSVW